MLLKPVLCWYLFWITIAHPCVFIFSYTCLFQGAFRGSSWQCSCWGSPPEEILHRKQKKMALGLGTVGQGSCEVEVMIGSFYFCHVWSLCTFGVTTRWCDYVILLSARYFKALLNSSLCRAVDVPYLCPNHIQGVVSPPSKLHKAAVKVVHALCLCVCVPELPT